MNNSDIIQLSLKDELSKFMEQYSIHSVEYPYVDNRHRVGYWFGTSRTVLFELFENHLSIPHSGWKKEYKDPSLLIECKAVIYNLAKELNKNVS